MTHMRPGNAKSFIITIKKHVAWFMVLPALLLLIALNIFPLIWSLGLSFYRFSLIVKEPPHYVGGLNYLELITSNEAWDRFTKTGIYIVLSLFLQFALGSILALLLFGEFKGKRTITTILMIPLMIAPVASAMFFRYLLDYNFGPINIILERIFGTRIYWLGNDPSPIFGIPYALISIVLVETWIWTPFVMYLLLAGMSAIPEDLIEQAEVDGLRFIYKLRYLILPHIKPMIAIILMFRLMDALKTFDTVYVLTAGGPGTTTELISMYIYRLAFERWDFGSATALSYLVIVFVIFMTNVFMRYLILKR